MNKGFIITMLCCILAFATSSCEKDDLCPTDIAATPRLILVFKNQTNPLLAKTVNNLQIREVGQTAFAPLNSMGTTTLTAVDSVAIPLKFDNAGTMYELIRTDDAGVVNTDIISFSYDLGEEYVNRACGFKAIYNNLTAIVTFEQPLERWIQTAIVLQANVTSNNAAHVEIRH